MRVALDTNILVYAEGVNGAERQAQALVILGALERDTVVIPVQALAELFAVLTRKAKWSVETAKLAVETWAAAYEAPDTTVATVNDAMELVVRHRLAFWDALIVATSVMARCDQLLTEDMQNGFTWRGLTLTNLFETVAGGP